jgi:hypothetical protein
MIQRSRGPDTTFNFQLIYGSVLNKDIYITQLTLYRCNLHCSGTEFHYSVSCSLVLIFSPLTLTLFHSIVAFRVKGAFLVNEPETEKQNSPCTKSRARTKADLELHCPKHLYASVVGSLSHRQHTKRRIVGPFLEG